MTSGADGMTTIRIGDPAVEVTGLHHYDLKYDINGIVNDQVVRWQPIGGGWDVTTDRIEAHVVARFELVDVRCGIGADVVTPCDDIRMMEPGHLLIVHEGLGSRQPLTIEATVGSALLVLPGTVPN